MWKENLELLYDPFQKFCPENLSDGIFVATHEALGFWAHDPVAIGIASQGKSNSMIPLS